MTPTPRDNAALVGWFLADVVAGGDTDAVEVFLADDAVDHNLVFGAYGEPTPGWRVLTGADVDVHAEAVVPARDRVAVRGTVTGTHRESLLDLAPTGSSFEIAHAWFCRIEDGRIAAIRSLPYGLGLLQQLDAGPGGPLKCAPTDPASHG